MFLNIEQVVRLLDVSDSIVRRWIRDGTIPSINRHGSYVFDRATLEAWAHSKHLKLHLENLQPKPVVAGDEKTDVIRALQKGKSWYDISGNNPALLYEQIGSLLQPSIRGGNLTAQLKKREELSSTGIGRGVAIPHPQNPRELGIVESMIHVFYPAQTVNFNSVDGLPVFVLFVVLSSSIEAHLILLAQLAQILRNNQMTDLLEKHPEHEKLITEFEKNIH
ncbi:MAG: PTS sugar transporter subunit IIA [SAR324 cluster bacterium]|nr:PTS sugar transporter subunit IIA [SAR324 cluster bacterium]